MSAREAELYVELMQLPSLLLLPLGLTSRYPPYSTVISNVPGPRQPMYWNGARLEGVYPASIVFDGFALNITLVTYDRNIDFGITACRRSLPQVQRLIDYLDEGLVELEEAAGLARTPRKKTTPRPRTRSRKAAGNGRTGRVKKVATRRAKG
jgi:diacylglycerol O-acyltransferase